jgi:hypothetical protein
MAPPDDAGVAPESHTQGSLVWVADAAESWVQAEVTKVEVGLLTVVTTEGEKTVKCKPEDAPIQNPDQRGGVEVGTTREGCACNVHAMQRHARHASMWVMPVCACTA